MALCVPSSTPLDVAFGLFVGHQDTQNAAANGFSVLDRPAGGIPTELASLLQCPVVVGFNQAPETAPRTMLARMVDRLADLLLPEEASARMYYFAGFGIGGTTKTFSPFGLVSPTLTATGGTGGTKTTFSPSNPDASAKAPSLTTLNDGTGNLQDSINVIQTTNLPKVLVKTKQGTLIPGATVTFKVANPITLPYSPSPSTAAVCTVGNPAVDVDQVVIKTGLDGSAQLDCLNFGNTLGYKDLAAVVDPSTAPGLSDAGGISNITIAVCNPTCDPIPGATDTLHWLVTTVTGPPANLTLTQAPGTTSAKLGAAMVSQPIAKVTDASNNPVSNVSVSVSLTTGGGTLGCYGGGNACLSGTTLTNGTVSFADLMITGSVAGTPQTLTFTAGSLSKTAAVTPTPGDAVNPALPTAPVAGKLGKALTTQPTVLIADTYGNPITGAIVTVELTAGGGTLGCFSTPGCKTAPTTGSDGTTTFADLMITGTVAGQAQTLTFTSGSRTTTATVTPSAGDPTILTIETAPVADKLGQAFTTQPKVKVTDTWSNPIAGASVDVNLTGGGGTLDCFTGTGCKTATPTAADGTISFASLMITGLVAGKPQTLTFSSTGTNSPTADVTAKPGDPAKIAVTNTPAGQVGKALTTQPTVLATDASNNPVPGVSIDVSLTTVGGTLGCFTGSGCTTATPTAADGTISFANLMLTGLVAGKPQTLKFTSGSLETTVTFTPAVGDPAALTVETAPVAGKLGYALTTQPKVKVTDGWNNPIAGASVAVNLTAGTGTLGCFTGSGCTTATPTAADGTISFANLAITGTGAVAEQTLTFSSAGTNSPTAPVTPTAGDAKNLAIVTAPVAGQLGKALTTQPKMKVTDTWSNAVSGATVTVGLTAGGGTLGCFTGSGCTSATPTAVDGTISFANLMITGLVANVAQTLTFSSTGTTAQTAQVTPTAGDAIAITANTPSGGTYSGSFAPFTAVSPSPVVKATDAYGNAVQGAGIVWQLAGTLTGATLSAASSSTGATGLSSVTWTLGDGGNGLTAFLGTTIRTRRCVHGHIEHRCQPGGVHPVRQH